MEDQANKLKKIIQDAEKTMLEAKKALQTLTGEDLRGLSGGFGGEGSIVEGHFDGKNMIDDTGKIYPVPANYASKSKLVDGDRLKLTIADDGSFLFKQIGPIERKRIIGVLKRDMATRGFVVEVEGKIYKVLLASITYFKAQEGNSVVLLVPRDNPTSWGAIENILGENEMPPQDIEVGYGGESAGNKTQIQENNVKSLDEIIGEVASEKIVKTSGKNKKKGEKTDEFEW